jgi:5-methyltetrahydrofolate--homocysteine methyltransferase
VAVVSSLLSKEGNTRKNFLLSLKEEYEQVRVLRGNRKSSKKYLSLEQARANKFKIDWTRDKPVKPVFLGIKHFSDYSLEELSEYIDWTPFFATWQLRGKYPEILQDEVIGEECKKLFNDAQSMLRRIIDEKWLTAKGVFGIFPANSVMDDDIEVYSSPDRQTVTAVLRNLRQQRQKAPGQPNYSLTDFVAPKESGIEDYIGAFAVTTGIGIERQVEAFEKNHDDYNAIMLKALADRLAEAFAERLHERVRKQFWAYAKDEQLDKEAIIEEKYIGIRPAPGYPACPEHTEKQTLFQLLDVEALTGIKLTESYAMYPAAAVSGWYYAHPAAKYFGLGNINYDQLEDYVARKGMTQEEGERWLQSVLNEQMSE